MSVATPHWGVPVLRPESETPAVTFSFPLESSEIPAHDDLNSVAGSSASPAVIPSRLPSIESVVVWVYLAGFFAMLAYRLAGWMLLRRVIRRSKKLRTARLRASWLLESADVVSPVAVGLLHPAVLLPIGWRDWSSDTRSAVLAHEFAHLRRNDTLVASSPVF